MNASGLLPGMLREMKHPAFEGKDKTVKRSHTSLFRIGQLSGKPVNKREPYQTLHEKKDEPPEAKPLEPLDEPGFERVFHYSLIIW